MIRRLLSTVRMRLPNPKAEKVSRFWGPEDKEHHVTRRITRSITTSRFGPEPASQLHSEPPAELTLGSDIEDALTRPARKRRRVAKSEDVVAPVKPEPASPAAPAKVRRKPARKVTDPTTGVAQTEPPTSWLETYNAVLAMRQPGGVASNAAVDTMGCERLADRSASDRDRRFQTLVALMLSSQTKDTVNAVVMARLKTELPAWREGEAKGLNLENMLAVEPAVLNEFIWAVGFHNNKTKYVLPFAQSP